MDWLNVVRTLPGDHWSRLTERFARQWKAYRPAALLVELQQFVADLRQLDADTTQYKAPDQVNRRA